MESIQIVLIIGLVLMGLINAASLIWAFYLDHRLRQKPVPKVYETHIDSAKVFKESDIQAIENIARGQLEQVMQDASVTLQKAIDDAVGKLATHASELGTHTLDKTFDKYQADLQSLRDQSVQDFAKMQAELNDRRTQLLQQIDQKVVEQYRKRLDEFDTRLADVVSGYLVESLGNNVDLGAQRAYIIRMLEQHKDDIKKDMLA